MPADKMLKDFGNKMKISGFKRDRSPRGRSSKRIRTGGTIAGTPTYEPTTDAMDVDPPQPLVPRPTSSDLVTSQAIAASQGSQVELPQSEHTMVPLRSGPRQRKSFMRRRRRAETVAQSTIVPEPSQSRVETDRNMANWRHSVNVPSGSLGYWSPDSHLVTAQQAEDTSRSHSVAVAPEEVRVDSAVAKNSGAQRQTWCVSESEATNDLDISRAAGAWAGASRSRAATLTVPNAAAVAVAAPTDTAIQPNNAEVNQVAMAQLMDGMGQLIARVNDIELRHRKRYDSMKDHLETEMADMFAENEMLRDLLRQEDKHWPRIAGRARHSYHFGQADVSPSSPDFLSEANQLRIKREREDRMRDVQARAARPSGFFPVLQRPRSMAADPSMSLEESMRQLSLVTSSQAPAQGLLAASEPLSIPARSPWRASTSATRARSPDVAVQSPLSSAQGAQNNASKHSESAGSSTIEEASAPLSLSRPQLIGLETALPAPNEQPPRSPSSEQGAMGRLRTFFGYGAASAGDTQNPDSAEDSPSPKSSSVAPDTEVAQASTALRVGPDAIDVPISPKSKDIPPKSKAKTAPATATSPSPRPKPTSILRQQSGAETSSSSPSKRVSWLDSFSQDERKQEPPGNAPEMIKHEPNKKPEAEREVEEPAAPCKRSNAFRRREHDRRTVEKSARE